jgi:hypothetical protein
MCDTKNDLIKWEGQGRRLPKKTTCGLTENGLDIQIFQKAAIGFYLL